MNQSMSFVGKLAAVGQGGSGKTRAIAEIANHLANQQRYPWVEEANLSGTLTVTPYSITIPPKSPGGEVKRVILADNPGQNSLELVRLSVAKSGANYLGILVFADALGWNFREVGILHAESIAQYMKTQDLPVAFITSKADMIIKFQQTQLMKEIAEIVHNAVMGVQHDMVVPFYDRVRNQEGSFNFYLMDGGWLPFTHLEQVLVNALDNQMGNRVSGFTIMNRRLFVRSLLLGYCDYYRHQYPEYIKQYPIFNAIDENLLNSLNYHRPTAWETGTPWKVLAAQSRSGITRVTKNEPPFSRDAFTIDSVEYVLKNYCLGTQTRHYELEGLVRQRAAENGWKFVASAYTDSVSKAGIERSVECIRKLVNAAESNIDRRGGESELDKLGLGEFS